MPETKLFMSNPIWSNPRIGRNRYYQDVKKTVGRFSTAWKYSLQNRSTVRLLKGLIVVALFITCIFNIKLAIEATINHNHHRLLFLSEAEDYNVAPNSLTDPIERKSNALKEISISVVSSQDLVEVTVNGQKVLHKNLPDGERGIHVVTLHQLTGSVMATRVFDTYTAGEEELLQEFIHSINDDNRILVFAVKDEASLNLHSNTRELLTQLGSEKINGLQWRSMWALITNKMGKVMAEDLKVTNDVSSWAESVVINSVIDPLPAVASTSCHWPSTPENRRREYFCSKYDGYGSLCSCDKPSELQLKVVNFTDNHVYDIPVAVIASNRPQYLFRMLTSLLSAKGVNPSKITVFIDGHFEETMEVTKLLEVKGMFHVPVGVKNARISQNYKSSLSAIFGLNPQADHVIILEEDLDVSPDFFHFFSQTVHLLDRDPTILCISAWNDHGYHHSCKDPEQLYRVEAFPGLGWMLSRKLFKEELEPQWPGPDKPWDWDMWMRQPEIMRNRECIIPDVSRTFHFGSSGINMNSYFHELYFSKHKINHIPDVQLKNVNSMLKDAYEKEMHLLVRESKLLDHHKSPCDLNFIQNNLDDESSYVAYLNTHPSHETNVFQKLFKCLKIWDLDVRGLHKHSFRTYINNKQVVFVAYPVSPYSIYKPVGIEPIEIYLDDEKLPH